MTFPSVADDDHSGFIMEDDDEGNSEVKSRRMNIANEMWRSYLNYIAETTNSEAEAEAIDSDDN